MSSDRARTAAPLCLLATLLSPTLAAAQSHAGVVTDDVAGPALEGAVVVVNRAARDTTDASGAFSVTTGPGATAEVVFATFPGRLTGYLELPLGSSTTALSLAVLPYPEPLDGFRPELPVTCAECHDTYVRGWGGRGAFETSAHAASALNPRVLDIWRGTASGRATAADCAAVGGELVNITDAAGDPVERCYVGAGLLPDMNPQCGHPGQPRCDDHGAGATSRPTAWSDCAGCHTPGSAIRVPEELDLDVAEASPAASSVTCAGCHRIADVGDPNAAGVLVGATVVRGHVPSGLPLGLGPLDDAGSDAMVTGHAPVFAESRLCAPCHQDTYVATGMDARWAPAGVPSEQTYAEWLESPYASGAREATCQDCHMRSLADLGIVPSLPEIAVGGTPRDASVIHTHDFPPRTDPASHEAALDLVLTARLEGDSVVVDASLTNVGVGHAFPSGVTSRNALVVVTAELPSGRLVEIGGDVLPLYAGSYDDGTVVSAAGSTLMLDHALDASAVGREIRLWTDTTTPHEHQSFGILRALPLAERGLMLRDALGRFRITAVRGAEVDVEATGVSLASLTGANFAIGDDERLAGVAGLGLAKHNVALDGTPDVPFWRATDVLWDNRLAPDETQRSEHRFALPAGSSGAVTVRARVLYRGAFANLAAQRGWEGNEHLALETAATVTLVAVDGGASDGGARSDAGLPATPTAGCACAAPRTRARLTTLAPLLAALALLTLVRRRPTRV